MGDIIVSVAMITYNHEKYIAQAIESVLAQKVNFKYEIIIGEDCSTDKTREIVRKYAERYPSIIKPIFREKNIGPINNEEEVLLKCRGKYIAYLEGDDYWCDNDKLQLQVDFLEKNPDYSLCAHNSKIFDNRLNAFVGRCPTITLDKFNNLDESIASSTKNNTNCHVNSYVFRNFFLNGEDNLKRLVFEPSRLVDDLQLTLINLHLGKEKVINRDMSVYRINSSKTCLSNMDTEIIYNEYLKVVYLAEDIFEHKYTKSLHKLLDKYNGIINNYKSIQKKKTNNYDVFSHMINLRFKEERFDIKKYFNIDDGVKFSIYGFGTIGKLLMIMLLESGIHPVNIIDQDSSSDSIEGIPLKTLNDRLDKVDLIIVTNVNEFSAIKDNLIKAFGTKVRIESIKDILAVN